MKTTCNPNVLLLAFNRFKETQKVIEAISETSNVNLYVSIDGPRNAEDNKIQQSIVELLRSKFQTNVQIRVSDQNHGCRRGVKEGITWFFSKVEWGIIIEDDCVPSSGAIELLDVALKKFSPSKYSAITGTNYITSNYDLPNGCFIENHYMSVWGWATWRNNWYEYLFSNKRYSTRQILKTSMQKFKSFRLSNILATANRKENKGESETWDYSWFIYNLMESKPNIVYNKNIFKNVGHNGAHATSKTENNDMRTYSVKVERLSLFSSNEINYNYKIANAKFPSNYKEKIKYQFKKCINY